MKNFVVGLGSCLLVGLVFLVMSCNSTNSPGKLREKGISRELEITYIGSSGYLIVSGNSKVMLDGVFDNFVKKFEVIVPTEDTRNMIGNGVEPFDSIDIFLVTHSHKGHYDRELLTRAIISNPNSRVVTNKAVYLDLKDNVDEFESFKERIYYPDLNIGDSLEVVLKDINIYITKTDHWGGLQQLNFEFEVDGINILYALEPEGYENKKDVDLQFLNSFDSTLNPEYLILTHQSGYENISQKEMEAETLENTSYLTKSLQKFELIIGE